MAVLCRWGIWKYLATPQTMKKKPKLPTEPTAPKSAEACRVAAIFHRQPSTKWTVKEIEKYMALHPVDVTEIALLERYYSANWPPRRGHNILRTDLITLLGNWPGEVDRAKIWTDQHKPRHQPRKIIPLPPLPEQQLNEAERAQFVQDYQRLTGRAWTQK